MENWYLALLAKPTKAFVRDEDGLIHLGTLHAFQGNALVAHVFAWQAKLIHFIEQKIVASEIVIGWIVGIASQITEVLHQHKSRVVLLAENAVTINDALER